MKHFASTVFFGLAVLILTANSHASDDKMGVTSDHPSLSPSGTEVVFSADFDGPGPNRLWIASLDKSKLRKIATSSLSDTEPAWSPTGRQIAFSSFDNGVSDIWVVQADGNYPVKLTANGANNYRPAWSPDGKAIAFASDKEGTNDIWIMNADGTGQRRITSLPGQENDPSFSPIGNKIVFSETEDDAASLMTANLDGSGLVSLTARKTNTYDWNPNWGVNGIVFSSNRDTSSEHWKIWGVQPDGTGLRRIADVVALDPVWMKDGRILFSDEVTASRALSTLSILNPTTGTKHVAVDIQGYIVPIDIRPGKPLNRVNPKSRGKIEVAILSTRSFDAIKTVNPSTLTFGRTGDEKSLSRCSKEIKDVNRDGLYDIRCRFELRKTGFQREDSIGVLRFLSVAGIPYEGRDGIATGLDDDPDDFKDED